MQEQETLIYQVVSMGNSTGKLKQNYRGQQEIICSREHGVTIGTVTNYHLRLYGLKYLAFSEK